MPCILTPQRRLFGARDGGRYEYSSSPDPCCRPRILRRGAEFVFQVFLRLHALVCGELARMSPTTDARRFVDACLTHTYAIDVFRDEVFFLLSFSFRFGRLAVKTRATSTSLCLLFVLAVSRCTQK